MWAAKKGVIAASISAAFMLAARPASFQSRRESARTNRNSSLRSSTVKPFASRVTSSEPSGSSAARATIAAGVPSLSRMRSHSSSKLESTCRTMAPKKVISSSTVVAALGLRNGLHQDLVDVGQVAQEQPFGALEAVLLARTRRKT